MKSVTVRIDASIPIADLARALASMGCMLSTDASGDLRVSKRRARKPVVFEAKQPKPK